MRVRKEILILLVLVACFAVFYKLTNPHRQYSSAAYWKTGTLEDALSIPDAALKPGNKNGSVLMFASGFVTDPAILTELVKRGSNVNEKDKLHGTPLSSAATLNSDPRIINVLVELGADVNVKLYNGMTTVFPY